MNLFEAASAGRREKAKPLAARMRPVSFNEIKGQEHLFAQGSILHRAVEKDVVTSIILYGPPGTGKTTVADVIAGTTGNVFKKINAVTSGVADIKKILAEAWDDMNLHGRKTILFIDEIHRFNKIQQDALLPAVEDGFIVLVGATTENPFFSVNSALISRSLVYRLNPLSEENIRDILAGALEDSERGLGGMKTVCEPGVLEFLAEMSGGDARVALNSLEITVLTAVPGEGGTRNIRLADAEAAIQKSFLRYDRNGDMHYDVISAFIKSMRGSDPDAVLHYLARMLESGEDPVFIARRIVIHAAEDVGMADPLALVTAEAALRAVQAVGMPEARIILAEAALYIAKAPKSNAVLKGIDNALEDVRRGRSGDVPVHLRDGHHKGAAARTGSGKGYLYPHDYPGAAVRQQYLPDELEGVKYFTEVDGKEKDE